MTIVVTVPASAANLGPGLDTLALAVALENTFRFEHAPRDRIDIVGPQASHLAAEDAQGIFRAMDAVYRGRGLPRPPLRITATSSVPVARGLGSSATAIIAGVMAARTLLGDPVSTRDVLAEAARLEGHPDNVAAAVLGGVTVAYMGNGQVEAVRLPHPRDLVAVAVVPANPLATPQARRVLPDQVPLADAVFNLGRVALLVGGLASGNLSWLRSGGEDRLHQPYRAHLVPDLELLIASALRAGGWTASLSGAGPTIIALSNRSQARTIAEEWHRTLASVHTAADVSILDIAGAGARVSVV